MPPASCLQFVFVGSALCLVSSMLTTSYEQALLRATHPVHCPHRAPYLGALLLTPCTVRAPQALISFCGFEFLLGIYWPGIALLRATALDDSQRSSTMSVFRLLLNLLVMTSLPLAGHESIAMGIAIGLLLVCVAGISVVKAESPAADLPSPTADSAADAEARPVAPWAGPLTPRSSANDDERDGDDEADGSVCHGAAGSAAAELKQELLAKQQSSADGR